MPAPRKTSAAAVKQEMQATLQEVQKATDERRDSDITPAQRIERRAADAAVGALSLKHVYNA